MWNYHSVHDRRPIQKLLNAFRMFSRSLDEESSVTHIPCSQEKITTFETKVDNIESSIDIAAKLTKMCLMLDFTLTPNLEVEKPAIFSAKVDIIVLLVIYPVTIGSGPTCP